MNLIVNISDDEYKTLKTTGAWNSGLIECIKNGTPLDSNSERAEVQAYFDGEAYGWEQGRKALIEDVKAEINKMPYVTTSMKTYVNKNKVLRIIDCYNSASEVSE